MLNTVCSETQIGNGGRAHVRSKERMQVVVVPRNPLAVLAKFTSPFEPVAQAMYNDDLVPESSFGVDCRDIRHPEIKCLDVIINVRHDREGTVRIERGLGARFNLHGGLDVSSFGSIDARVPDKQGLAAWIGLINLNTAFALRVSIKGFRDGCEEIGRDITAAIGRDRIKGSFPFFCWKAPRVLPSSPDDRDHPGKR